MRFGEERPLILLQAMNTGHDGSLTTVHANTPRDALARVENMVTMSSSNLPLKAIRTQIASAINFVIQLERHEDGKRRLVSVQEVEGMEGEVIIMSEIFKFQRQGIGSDGEVLGILAPTGLVPQSRSMLEKKGLPLDMNMFEPNNF